MRTALEIIANAFMNAESLLKYLQFELAKMTEETRLSKQFEATYRRDEPWPLRIIQSLRAAYVHTCLERISRKLAAPDELKMRDAGPIFDQARKAYHVTWEAEGWPTSYRS